ncbi:MAG: DUF3365 domain-containing protein [Gemmataceae bacterium]
MTGCICMKKGVVIAAAPLLVAGAWLGVARGFDLWPFAAQTVPVVAPAPVAESKPATPKGPSNHAGAPELLARTLQRLHQEALAHFHSDPRNGLYRMPLVYDKVVAEWKTPWLSPGDLEGDEPVPFRKEMEALHGGSVKDFLSAKRPAPPPSEVLGFDAKAIKAWEERTRTAKFWEVKQVDLIGLLKNDEPVVYISERLPELKETGRAPKRPLDEFEAIALTHLEKGENLFGRSRDGVIRMLGSVRAETSCLSCHEDKKAGDLLGAFSYTVREAHYAKGGLDGGKRVPVRP